MKFVQFRCLNNENGMALLLTVMTISLLIALTVEFHRSAWQNLRVANNYKVRGELHGIAVSGINIASALLEVDAIAEDFDTLQDDWAAISNNQFSGLFPGGSLQVETRDLSGRLQINSLVLGSSKSPEPGLESNHLDIQKILLRLLTSGSFIVEQESEAKEIVDSLVDWIDEDNKESDFGAESGYYQSLEKTYSCRNGPIQYIEELLLIKGITPDLLYGKEEFHALSDYLTVYGSDGKINLNTAPLLLIRSFESAIDDELAGRFEEYRTNPDNRDALSSTNWYSGVTGWPGDVKFNEKIVDTKSTYFQVKSTGVRDSLTKTIVVDLKRDNEGELTALRTLVE